MKRICVITGTRAEYGILHHLMKDIADAEDLQLQIVATSMHLSPEFGSTYREIEADGFVIDAKVEMLLSSDSPAAIVKSVGVGTLGLADTLTNLAPDLVLLLGDRFEVLAAAQTALLLRIPIVHLHGGERTEGAVDEAIRHAVSKMAHIHLVATEAYRRRVIQLGEHPDRVHNVGALGVENIRRTQLLSREALAAALNLQLGKPLFLVTYHPVTLGDVPPESAMAELIDALQSFEDATILFTYPNADTFGRGLIKMMEEFNRKHPQRTLVAKSLGQTRYLSALRQADVVIGNSSSGIIEAPSFDVPTVNVGIRQLGREHGPTVLDCEERRDAIRAAIEQALDPAFLSRLKGQKNPYEGGATSARIVSILRELDDGLLGRKTFFDLPPTAS